MSRIGHWVWEARLLFKCFNLRNWSQQRVHWPHGKDSSHWGTNWSTRHWFYLIFVYIYTSILSHACIIPWHKKRLHWLIWRWSWRKSLHLITTSDRSPTCKSSIQPILGHAASSFCFKHLPCARSASAIVWKQGTAYPTPIFSYFLAMNSLPWP